MPLPSFNERVFHFKIYDNANMNHNFSPSAAGWNNLKMISQTFFLLLLASSALLIELLEFLRFIDAIATVCTLIKIYTLRLSGRVREEI